MHCEAHLWLRTEPRWQVAIHRWEIAEAQWIAHWTAAEQWEFMQRRVREVEEEAQWRLPRMDSFDCEDLAVRDAAIAREQGKPFQIQIQITNHLAVKFTVETIT